MGKQTKSIGRFIAQNQSRKVDDLATDAQVLFGLLTRIVDIKYRNKYMKSFDYNNGRGYSEEVHNNNVLADQIPPVDEGLLGI